jgi:hypothetical protein
MPAEDFFEGLRGLGYEVSKFPQAPGAGAIDYDVPVGPRAGERIRLAFQPPGDWPLTCPSGPHVSPNLLPLNPSATNGHPSGGVHAAPHLGPDWQYWSRPFLGWGTAGRNTVAAYMAHIRHLFATL